MTHPDQPGQGDNDWHNGRPDEPTESPTDPRHAPGVGSDRPHPEEADQPTQINPVTSAGSADSGNWDGGHWDGGHWEGGRWEGGRWEGGSWQQAQTGGAHQGQHGQSEQQGQHGQPGQQGQQWQGQQPAEPQSSWRQPGGQSSASHPAETWQPGHQAAGQWQSAQRGPYDPPVGQSSAGRPQGQGSAGYPQSAPSAGYPQGQPSAGYPQSGFQPGAGYQPGAAQQGYGQQHVRTGPTDPYQGWGGGAQPPAKKRFGDANPFRAAFDFSFNSYATPGLVKIIYVLAVVIAALWWIGGTITTFVMGAAVSSLGDVYGSSGSGGGVAMGIVYLIFGWIPALLWVLFVRVVLEAAMALVRVAEDARSIREKVDN